MLSTLISIISSSSLLLNVLIYSMENFKTFLSRMASVITYLCKHSSNKSFVVRLPCSFLTELSLNIGVPVKPNICAFSKNALMRLCVSPNWLLWHSSKIKTMRSFLRASILSKYLVLFIAVFNF